MMMKPDRYSFCARLLPSLTIAIPLVLAVLPWLPPDTFHAKGTMGMVVKYASSGAVAVALAYFLGQLARGLGGRLEARLWEEWGGRPSVVFLRHRSPDSGSKQKLDLHARIRSLNPTLQLPSPNEERGDPGEADHCYERVSAWLRGSTRDAKRFPLLFEDNLAYGFRRNLLALRPYAFGAGGIGIISGAVAYWLFGGGIATIVGSTLVTMYAAHNSVDDVRRQSDKYTRSLFDTLDLLNAPSTSRKAPRKSASGGIGGKDAA